MKQRCCSDCRLRFTGAAAAYLDACPQCDAPLGAMASSEVVGFRRFSTEEFPHAVSEAVAIAMPLPAPDSDGA